MFGHCHRISKVNRIESFVKRVTPLRFSVNFVVAYVH